MPLLLLLLLAQQGLPEVPPRMEVDQEPSAAACTFDGVLSGATCLYEASGGPGEARDNSRAAAEAGQRACVATAGRDEALRRDCEKAVAEVSLSPSCALSSRLADGEGRLTPQAQACAQHLREAVAHTSRAAALSLGCCGCLAEARCSVSTSLCRHELADLMPGPALRSCLQKSCPDACAFAAPGRAPEPQQELPPEDARHPSKI